MLELEKISENSLINFLTKGFSRSPAQINALQESDAELIRIPGTDTILAVTTDSIAEEIQSGLYDNPYLAGRMAVLVNLSDISAVGAEPLGLILNETFSPKTSNEYIEEVQKGISDACTEANTFIFGGDTNFSENVQIGATAVGIIKDNKIITRKGCCEGDYLFSSGRLGSGNAFAVSKLLSKNQKMEFPFNPQSRIKEGMLIRKYASCCMDTSDGVIATLDQLMRINQKGFKIESVFSDYINPYAILLCAQANISEFNLLAGIHGEFELLFTIPREKVSEFLTEVKTINSSPVKLGVVTADTDISFNSNGKYMTPDTKYIRNLFNETEGDIAKYAYELMKYSHQLIQTSD